MVGALVCRALGTGVGCGVWVSWRQGAGLLVAGLFGLCDKGEGESLR